MYFIPINQLFIEFISSISLLGWRQKPPLSIYLPPKKDLFFKNSCFIFVADKFRIMNRRLLQFLQAENITQTQLADTLSVARGSVSNILAGRNKPGYDFLESLILHYPNLNLEWLLSGKGKMYHEAEAPQTSQEAPSQQEDPVQLDLFSIPTSGLPQREISKIMIFFSDKTFQEFRQSD